MISQSIEYAELLNDYFNSPRSWANGKNFPVDHLHPTVAESRWEYENIWGIYLTNVAYSWMALWMAISNREVLRKRQVGYIRPDLKVDCLGGAEFYGVKDVAQALCSKAYVYLFDPNEHAAGKAVVDIGQIPNPQKTAALQEAGFVKRAVERHGRLQPALVDASSEPRIILVDEWQIVLTNTKNIVPDRELIIESRAIEQLAGRIALTNLEIGEDYIH